MVAAVVIGTAAFGAALALRETLNPWAITSAAAALTIVVAAWVMKGRLRPLMKVRPVGAVVAIVLGIGLVLATHLAYSIAVDLFPSLGDIVSGLYLDIGTTSPGAAVTVPLIAVVVLAEELLWRGVVMELVAGFKAATAAAIAVVLYALPQLIGQSVVLIAAAVIVGSIFTLQRMVSGRLIEPMLTHAVWSVSIFSLFPLV